MSECDLESIKTSNLNKMKQCARCGLEKTIGVDFTYRSKTNKDGFSSWCNGCHSESRLEKYQKNADQERARNRDWKKSNRSQINAYMKNRRASDILFRLRMNVGSRINGIVRKKNLQNIDVEKLIGCSVAELFLHLESQFQPGMSWDNYGNGYGKWNIDHIYPLSLAKTKEDLYKLNHFRNLRPMWYEDNLKKGNKLIVSEPQ